MIEITVDGLSAEFHLETDREYELLDNDTLINERPALEDLAGEIRPTDIFYDVGANIGLYSCLIAPHVEKTVAFEPAPMNLNRLYQNVEHNNISVKVYRDAVSNFTGWGNLDIPNEQPGAGQVSLSPSGDEETTVLQLDDLKEPPPDVIKIDVEGAEVKVLQGAFSLLNRSLPRLLYVEHHSDDLRTSVINRLNGHGYQTEQLTDEIIKANV